MSNEHDPIIIDGNIPINTFYRYRVNLVSIATENRDAMDILEPIFDALRTVKTLELNSNGRSITIELV